MRRNNLDILKSMLTLCSSKGVKKTEMAYKSNLNFKKSSDYLDWMLKHSLLKLEKNLYEITPAGRSLLANLNEISDIEARALGLSAPSHDEDDI